jgi:hypothetical protein
MKILYKYFVPVALAVAILTPGVKAGSLEITISDGGVHPNWTITDNGAGDTNPAANQISVSQPALAQHFPELRASSTIIVTFTTTSPAMSTMTTEADLVMQKQSLFPHTPSTASFTITSSQTGFLLPLGSDRAVNTSASFTFPPSYPTIPPSSSNNTGETASFQGGVSTSNTIFNQNVADTLLTGSAPAGGSPSGAGTSFNNGGGQYAITNVLKLNMNESGRINDAGTTVITATPEPSTLVLACLAGVPFAVAGFRRWGRKDAAQNPLIV